MTYTITNDDTGAVFSFASEGAYEAAMDWYNATSKNDIIAYCEAGGVSLDEATTDPYYKNGVKLVSDWADRAMQFWATNQ